MNSLRKMTDPMKIALKTLAVLMGLSLFAAPAARAQYYWDMDGDTPGAGGATPSGTWSTGGTTWSTSSTGALPTLGVTTAATDNLFFSAGINGTGANTITLDDNQNAGSLTFQEGTATISGAGGGIITLGTAGGIITVNNLANAIIGANTDTIIAGSLGVTKTGVGTLTLNGSAVHTFTGGLNVNGGILALNFANLATPTDLINSGNALSLGGGTLSITGKSTGTTSQTLGNVTVNSGGGQILGNTNGGDALEITLGSIIATDSGSSLAVGTSVGGTSPVITTTTNKDATGIYGGRMVFATGTAATGFDWATTSSTEAPYTLEAYTGYTALASSGEDTNNSRITGTAATTANLTTNSLKFAVSGNSQTLTLVGTLTLSNGGLLITGTGTGANISGGSITAGSGSNYELVVHQFNTASGNGSGIANNPKITSTIANNGSNPVKLVKAGTGSLMLYGANTFTGGIIVNGGTFGWKNANALNNNSITFNANTTVLADENATITGGITINNGSMISFGNNTKTFNVGAAVTGAGAGITLIQTGGGATILNFNSTANNFTGPIRYAVTAQQGTLTVNSLADSDSYGEGTITFGVSSSASIPHNFNYGAGAIAALTLNNRRFELANTHASQSINNNSAQPFTINTDLLSSGTGTKTLTLGGTGTGLSTFAGNITTGTITTLNITKAGSGTWALDGTGNTFTGAITLNSTTTSAGTLSYASAAGTNAITFLQTTSTATLSYTGSGLTMSGPITANALTTGTITLDASGTGAINYSNTGSLGSAGSGIRKLVLSGTNTGNNILSGQWVNNTGAAATLTKNGAGTWILTNNNTYTGATTISAGTLLINGVHNPTSSAPAYSVNATGTLGGSGTIIPSVSVAANGTLAGGDPAVPANTTLFFNGGGFSTVPGSNIGVRLLLATPNNNLPGQPNPTSNSFLNVVSGTTTIDSGTVFVLSGNPGLDGSTTIKYRIATGTGDQSSLNISSPAQFDTTGLTNGGLYTYLITGDNNFNDPSTGNVYLTMTPVPEPATILGLAAAGIGFAGWVRRRRNGNAVQQM